MIFVYVPVKLPNSRTNMGTLFYKGQNYQVLYIHPKQTKTKQSICFFPVPLPSPCISVCHFLSRLLPSFPNWPFQILTGPSSLWTNYFKWLYSICIPGYIVFPYSWHFSSSLSHSWKATSLKFFVRYSSLKLSPSFTLQHLCSVISCSFLRSQLKVQEAFLGLS